LAENFSDPQLLAQARAILVSRVARLVTAERVVASEAERQELALKSNAAAVDMETAWIAHACAERKVPMLSLRVISDTAEAPFPAPPALLFDVERQRTETLKLTAHLFKHPFAVVRL